MKHKIFFLFSLFFIVLACNKNMEKPKDLLARDKFKSIVTQMYIYKQMPLTVSNEQLIQPNMSMAVLKKYNITPEQFKNSLEYYMVQDDALTEILKEIQDSIKQYLPEEKLKQTNQEDFIIEESIE